MKSIYYFFIFLVGFGGINLKAQVEEIPQNQTIEVFLGHAWQPGKAAQGFSIAMEFERNFKGRHFGAIQMRHLFASSDRLMPSDYSGNEFFFMHDYQNPFDWEAGRFSGINFPSRPNRYFNFNLGVQYRYEWLRRGKHRLRSGIGLVFTYRDEVEIAQIFPVKSISGVFEGETHLVPIYRYNSFLDFGFTPELAYRYQLSERLALGVQSQLSYFPGPGHAILATGATLGVALGPRVYRLQGRQKSGQ